MDYREDRWFCAVAGVVIVLVVTELVLRFGVGFCDALLYQTSGRYEYIAQPNQDRWRFGARIRFNSFSQRSEEPDSTRKKILGLGDSVLFGGTWMDQDSLATTLFTNETGVQMLNISCGSWGPDNCYEYLKENGTFGAEAMVLVCSSHDAFDGMSFVPVVGVWPNYPDKQYRCAIWELIDRYAVPRIRMAMAKREYLDPDAQVEKKARNRQVVQKSVYFVNGFDNLKHLADSVDIPFYIYLHAELGEVADGVYNDMGMMIIQWADSAGVNLVNGIKEGEAADMYRDAIHLNEKGHRHLASVLERAMIAK